MPRYGAGGNGTGVVPVVLCAPSAARPPAVVVHRLRTHPFAPIRTRSHPPLHNIYTNKSHLTALPPSALRPPPSACHLPPAARRPPPAALFALPQDYKSMVDLVRTLGTTAAGPKVLVCCRHPPPSEHTLTPSCLPEGVRRHPAAPDGERRVRHEPGTSHPLSMWNVETYILHVSILTQPNMGTTPRTPHHNTTRTPEPPPPPPLASAHPPDRHQRRLPKPGPRHRRRREAGRRHRHVHRTGRQPELAQRLPGVLQEPRRAVRLGPVRQLVRRPELRPVPPRQRRLREDGRHGHEGARPVMTPKCHEGARPVMGAAVS